MKKNKLMMLYDIDFEVIGIVSNEREYFLVWNINKFLKISLNKQEDKIIDFSNNTSITISYFIHKDNLTSFELLKNKTLTNSNKKYKFLIPELNQFDYLLKIKDETDELDSKKICRIITKIPIVEYVQILNFENLKSRDNLIL